MVKEQAAEDHVIVLREGIVEGVSLEKRGAKGPLVCVLGRDGHRLRAQVTAVNLDGEPFSACPFRQGGGVVPTAAGQIQNPQLLVRVHPGQGTDRSEQGTNSSAEGIDPAQTLQGLAVGDRIDAGLVHPLGLPVPLGKGRETHQTSTRWMCCGLSADTNGLAFALVGDLCPLAPPRDRQPPAAVLDPQGVAVTDREGGKAPRAVSREVSRGERQAGSDRKETTQEKHSLRRCDGREASMDRERFCGVSL